MDKVIQSIFLIIVLISSIGFVGGAIFVNNNQTINNTDLIRINNAKQYILDMVSQPDTVVFHDEFTVINDHCVIIKFTYKNGFGITDTVTMNIND